MDEESAARYTCKQLLNAWNKKELRANFKATIASLLDWLFVYAVNPFESLLDLAEQFLSEAKNCEEAICDILDHFNTWLDQQRQQQEISNGGTSQPFETFILKHLSRSEDTARALKLFSRHRPKMLSLLSKCPVSSGNSQRYGDAVYSVFSPFLGARQHDEALVVFNELSDQFRATITERHATHMAKYLICTGNREIFIRYFERCAKNHRKSVLDFLDSLLDFTHREFERELSCCPGAKVKITRVEFEEFLENLINKFSLPMSQFPSLQMRSKIKMFRFLIEKAINTSDPEMDLPSFCEIVAEMGENDTNFQEQVIRVLRGFGQFDLAHYFSRDCFPASKHHRSGSTSDQPLSKRSRTTENGQQRPPPPPPPPILAALSHKRPSGSEKGSTQRQSFKLSLDDSNIILVQTAEMFRSVMDKLTASSLTAFRLFWRNQIPDKTKRKLSLSLLAVAIPNQVYLLDLTRLPLLLENQGGLLFWLRDLLESDKMIRLVFRPNEELEMLQRELEPTSHSQHFTMSSLRDLAVFVDPKRHRRSTLPSLARRWLNVNLPINYRFTNWLRRPLSREQLRFAAMECYVLLEIYQKMADYCLQNNVDFVSLRRLTLKAVDEDSSQEDAAECSSDDGENNYDLFPPGQNGCNNNFQESLPISSLLSSSSVPTKFTVTCSALPIPVNNNHAFLPPPLFDFDRNSNNSSDIVNSGGDSGYPSFTSAIPSVSLKKSIINPYASAFSSSSSSSKNQPEQSVVEKREHNIKGDHIYFHVAHEFPELAFELVRIGFCVQLLSQSESSSLSSIAAVSMTKGDNRRVVLGRRELVDDVNKNRKHGGNVYEGLVVSATNFEETGRAVPSILRDLKVAPWLIEARLIRAPKYPGPKDLPLIVFYPREFFPRSLRERLRPKVFICPVPTGENISDEQLAIIAGLGSPEANRVLMTDSPNGERLKKAYGSSLRILIVPKMYIASKQLDQLADVIIGQVKEFARESRRPSSSSSSLSSIPTKSTPPPSTCNIKPVQTKSPLSKFALLCAVDTTISQMIDYLELIGFSCSRVVANSIQFRRALEMSKAGKKLLVASETFAANEAADNFILVKDDGHLLSAIYAIANKLNCIDLVDSRLNFFTPDHDKLSGKIVVYSNLHRCTYDFLSHLAPLVSPIYYDSAHFSLDKVIDIAAKEKRCLVTDVKTTFSSEKLVLRTNLSISYISLCPDSVVEEVKYIFRQLRIDPCNSVPEKVREFVKQERFIIHPSDALKIGSYLQLVGCTSVNTDHTSLPFTEVCKIAKREGAILIAKKTEANRLFLTQKSDASAILPPERVILLQLPSHSLNDLLTVVLERLSNLATTTNNLSTSEENEIQVKCEAV